jgi:GAF domain-containing protein/HAMP domain-containing protein
LDNGSWDNANNEPAAVFLPAGAELTDALVAELNTLKQTEFNIPVILAANPEIIAIYYGGVAKDVVYFPNTDLAATVAPDFDVTTRPWFVAASPSRNPEGKVVWSVPYIEPTLNGLVVTSSVPVFDARGNFRGVFALDIQLNRITALVSQIHAGLTGYAFMADVTNRMIAMPQAAYDDLGANPDIIPLGEMVDRSKLGNVPPEFFEILTQVAAGKKGVTTVTIDGVERFVVYQPIPEVKYALVTIVPTDELLGEGAIARQQVADVTSSTLLLSAGLVAALLIIAALAALGMGNALTAPLRSITRTAREISAGNLAAQAEVRGRDEIGVLAQALNSMTGQLRESINTLEQRVAERTSEVETARQQTEKRAVELQTVGEISSKIAGEQKIDTLLPLICAQVSERFDFYHVGIFLVDESAQYAVLRAANSEGGHRMLNRGHRLEVGQTGIVGYVAKTGQPRIALDVGADSVFFNNPDLAATRSEMALPLKVHGQTIGVLDAQSTLAGAFTQNDIDILTILADQVGIAIDNARLFGETQFALQEVQALYSQYLNQEWTAFSQKASKIGYQRMHGEGRELTTRLDTDSIREVLLSGEVLVQNPADGETEGTIVMPVKLRGQVIGILNIKAPTRGRRWSEEEVNMIKIISERLALALENARLFEETTRTAEREKLVSEITTSIRSTNDPQVMIEMAVAELRRALGVSRVEIIPQRIASAGID